MGRMLGLVHTLRFGTTGPPGTYITVPPITVPEKVRKRIPRDSYVAELKLGRHPTNIRRILTNVKLDI